MICWIDSSGLGTPNCFYRILLRQLRFKMSLLACNLSSYLEKKFSYCWNVWILLKFEFVFKLSSLSTIRWFDSQISKENIPFFQYITSLRFRCPYIIITKCIRSKNWNVNYLSVRLMRHRSCCSNFSLSLDCCWFCVSTSLRLFPELVEIHLAWLMCWFARTTCLARDGSVDVTLVSFENILFDGDNK